MIKLPKFAVCILLGCMGVSCGYRESCGCCVGGNNSCGICIYDDDSQGCCLITGDSAGCCFCCCANSEIFSFFMCEDNNNENNENKLEIKFK